MIKLLILRLVVVALALAGSWYVGDSLYADWSFLHQSRLNAEQQQVLRLLQQRQQVQQQQQQPKPLPAEKEQ